jgi:NNP family nitrate/nitrite transporter-like MFS transporter
MSVRALRHEGHWPSLLASLMHFEVSFSIWVLLGALGPFIATDFHLSPALKGVLVATPLLAAAFFRIVVGLLADRFGPRRIGSMTMVGALIPLFLGWRAHGTGAMFVVAALLGIAGASFAVALPLAGAHYPPRLQGLVLGIAGAGNSGTIVTALFAPRIANHIGWHATFGVAMIPVALAAIAFRVMAREAPRAARALREPRRARAILRTPESWRMCALYAVTFGGYVGFTSYLSIFLVDRFGLAKVTAGGFAAMAAAAGSFLRPAGGYFADRIGGARVLARAFVIIAALGVALSTLPRLGVTVALFVVLLGTLGIGNGAVFQLVAERFASQMGLMTGIVGAAGGIGGFFLPSMMGAVRGVTGSWRVGFLIFAAFALVDLVVLRYARAGAHLAPADAFDEAVA